MTTEHVLDEIMRLANDDYNAPAERFTAIYHHAKNLLAQRPPASPQTNQWRELADNLDETEEWLRPVKAALHAAADACDQLTHARDFHFEAANRYGKKNAKLRDLLASIRDDADSIDRDYIGNGHLAKRILAAIDAATKR